MPTHKIIPQYRLETKTTRSSRAAEALDKPDADPLGWRRVFTQAAHDLYGTKDVQDAIMATYVWMADQIGHLALGLLPTLLLGWVWQLICHAVGLGEGWAAGGCIVIAVGLFLYWISKERQDYVDTYDRAVKRFPFNSADIRWNIETALLYFGIGGLLALAALIGWPWLLGALAVAIYPGVRVAFWWLRRKLAFQQAGLPYLYRLTNFKGVIGDEALAAVAGLCDLKDRPIVLWKVLFRRDIIEKAAPVTCRHLLITGPLRSGKTSLAVGMGTEFAFALGIGRYLSASKLMELMTGPPDANKMVESEMEYDDGRLLWPLAECDLVLVDDVDGGLPTEMTTGISVVRPLEFQATLESVSQAPAPLAWLANKRTVWVLGNTTTVAEWKMVIASLMNIWEDEIMTIELKWAPPPEPEPQPQPVIPSDARRRIVGFVAGAVGLLALALSACWWHGEARWGRFEALKPEQAFADGTFGLELAPLKYILVASELSGTALQLPGGKPWPERFGFIGREKPSSRPCAADAPANLPVGFSVSNRLPGSATPVPVKFVGLSCAACHATAVTKGGPPILGVGSQTADVIGFTDAFLSAVLDTGPAKGTSLDAARILAAYDKQARAANCPDDDAIWPFGWIERRAEAFFIDQWLAGARAQARINEAKYDLPFHGAEIGRADNIPTGPSRTRPFRSVVRNTLDLPGATNHALSKVPLAAMQGEKPWSQFDGSVGDPVLRSLIAIFTSGATIAGLAEPQIVHNIRAAADYTLALGRTPPLPALAATFPDLPRPAADRLARGQQVYGQQCAGCHGQLEAGGWKMPPLRAPPQPNTENVGTDMARLDFRYSDMLPAALATILPKRDIKEQLQLIDEQRDEAVRKGAFAQADWWRGAAERLDALSRQFPAGHPLAEFSAREIVRRDGYLNAPIQFTWLRAPYLHNGSVLTLRALIGLDEREAVFCRGPVPGYDPQAVGLVTVRPAGKDCPSDTPFLFNTALPGNSNAGHVYPPASAGVSRADLEALLDYLRTL